MREAIKLKKEASQASSAPGSPEAADGVRDTYRMKTGKERTEKKSENNRRERSDPVCPAGGSAPTERTVAQPITLILYLGTATWPSTLTFDTSWVQPGVGSHTHHQVQRGVSGQVPLRVHAQIH